jgi:hypothetical protein
MKKDESLLVGAFKINMYRSVLPNFQFKSKSGDIHPFLTEKKSKFREILVCIDPNESIDF